MRLLQKPVFMGTVSDNSLGVLKSVQKGFITSIRLLQGDTELPVVQLKHSIAEMFPPALVFSKEICDMPIAFMSLRDFLDTQGANMSQHSSRGIIVNLASNQYE